MTGARVLRVALVALLLPVVLFLAWWFGSAGSTNLYFPPLSSILSAFTKTWTGSTLRDDGLVSLVRLVVGYLLACVVGVSVGVAVGTSRVLRELTEPAMEFIRSIPPPTLVPVFILIAGIGDVSKVAIIAFGAVWPILLNSVEGARSMDEVLVDTCRTYDIRGTARLRHLVLRSASPQIVTGMRQALAVAIVLMVVSEMFAATNGIGFQIITYQRTFQITQMWSGILLLSLVGVIAAGLFAIFESRVLRWYRGIRRLNRAE